MDRNTAFSNFWEILNTSEDYLRGGYRTEHTPPPDFHFQRAPEGSSEEEKPVAGAEEGTPDRSESRTEPTGRGPLDDRIRSCRRCDLYMARRDAIVGDGPDAPRLLVIAPPPGYDEDDRGVPMDGESREFLFKWIEALGVSPGEVYLTNGVKCRTPGTRPPLREEIVSCRAFLDEQIKTLKPRAILLLGETAASAYVDWEKSRGRPIQVEGTFAMATYEPVQVLNNPALKRPVWEDLKILKSFLRDG